MPTSLEALREFSSVTIDKNVKFYECFALKKTFFVDNIHANRICNECIYDIRQGNVRFVVSITRKILLCHLKTYFGGM